MSAVNVAVPLFLDAQSLFPTWNWQYHALVSFLVFASIMVWMVIDRQLQLNKEAPQMTVGNQSKASVVINKPQSEVNIILNLRFRNMGTRSAYQFRLKGMYSPYIDLRKHTKIEERSTANRIDPGGDLERGYDYTLTEKYVEEGGHGILQNKGYVIYLKINYSDSPSGGKQYGEEWWFSPRFDRAGLSEMSLNQKQEYEPYVRKVFPKRG